MSEEKGKAGRPKGEARLDAEKRITKMLEKGTSYEAVAKSRGDMAPSKWLAAFKSVSGGKTPTEYFA